jgi:hypothetical protein
MRGPPPPGAAAGGVSYGGRCVRCGGRHALRPDAAALDAARAVARSIAKAGRLDYDAPPPGDPRFSIAYLDGRRAGGFGPTGRQRSAASAQAGPLASPHPTAAPTTSLTPSPRPKRSKGPGRMLGVLVARDPSAAPGGGPGALRTLKAFSGQITESWDVPGWVGPVQAVTSAGGYYAAVRRVTEALGARIDALRALQRAEAEMAAQGRQRSEGSGGDGGGGGGGSGGGGGRGRRARTQRPTAGGSSGGGGAAGLSSSQAFVAGQLQLLTVRRKRLSHHLLEQVGCNEGGHGGR